MTNRYRPSNGTEGADFMARFCDRCKRDAKFQLTGDGEDSCPIARDTGVYLEDDPRYPVEWIYGDDDQPTCTAFEPETRG